MNCGVHHDLECVGVCAHCGKGVCAACAIESAAGRLVCSKECGDRLHERQHFFKQYFLYGLGGLLVCLSVILCARQEPFVGVVLAFYSLGCLLAGSLFAPDQAVNWEAGRPAFWIGEEIRLRAGIALNEAHQFRKELSDALAAYARLTGESIHASQLGQMDANNRSELLARMCRACHNIPDWIAPDAATAARRLAEKFALAQSISWTLFSQHDSRTEPYPARHKMLLELISAERQLQQGTMELFFLKDALERQSAALDKATRKDSK